MLEMTQAEYARHRKVTKQAIGKLVKAGKVPVRVDERGRKLIDAAAADRALGEVRERIVAHDDDDDTVPAAQRGSYVPPNSEGGLTKAKTATEVYRARLAQLEYDERIGRLVPTAQVTARIVRCGEAAIRVIDRLPNAADDLAGEMARDGVHGLRRALQKLAARMRNETADAFEQNAADDSKG